MSNVPLPFVLLPSSVIVTAELIKMTFDSNITVLYINQHKRLFPKLRASSGLSKKNENGASTSLLPLHAQPSSSS